MVKAGVTFLTRDCPSKLCRINPTTNKIRMAISLVNYRSNRNKPFSGFIDDVVVCHGEYFMGCV